MRTIHKAITKAVFAIILLLSSSLSFAKGMSIDAPYVREVPPGQMISASFMTLKNDNDKEVALIKASSDVAKTVELHEHVHEDGMMKMRQVAKIVIPANGATPLKPGGYHIMLIGLQRKIKAGDKIDINLEFDDGEKKTITATVKKVMMGMKMGGKKEMKHGAMKMGKMKMDDKGKMDFSHLNPMPNLMTVFLKTPGKLKLSEEQTAKIKAGIKKRDPKIKDLYKAVNKYEKELLEATLADKPLSDLDQLATNIMQERLNIIRAKTDCAMATKDILSEEQFANLQKIYKDKFAKKRVYSNDDQGKMAMLKHVSPMPNLMLVILKMSDKLNLNEKQQAKLKAWRDERQPVMDKQFKTIVKLENELLDAALNNSPQVKQDELADAIMQNRMKVIRGKAFCREKIQENLKPEQYKKVIELYKANFM